MTLGKRIREARIKSNMTQEELAQKVGLQKPAIYKYEKGLIANIPLDRLTTIASALDTTPGKLLGWDREPDELDKAVLELYPDFIPGKNYLPTKEEAAEISEEDADIRFIARKMKKADPQKKEMLMRMIEAAFADEDDNE